MARWLWIVVRNRIAALLAFAAVASVVGGAGALVYRQFRGETMGMVAASAVSLALLLLIVRHPWPVRVAERMAAEERAADPHPRY